MLANIRRVWRWINPQPKPVVYRERTPAERAGEARLDARIECELRFRDLGEDAGLCSCGQHTGGEQF